MTMRRDWAAAVAAHGGKPCIVCGEGPTQIGHLLGRAHDDWVLDAYGRRTSTKRVHPLETAPLCEADHRDYDHHKLNLLPHLEERQVVRCVEKVGLGPAMRRIQNTRDWKVPDRYAYLQEVNAA